MSSWRYLIFDLVKARGDMSLIKRFELSDFLYLAYKDCKNEGIIITNEEFYQIKDKIECGKYVFNFHISEILTKDLDSELAHEAPDFTAFNYFSNLKKPEITVITNSTAMDIVVISGIIYYLVTNFVFSRYTQDEIDNVSFLDYNLVDLERRLFEMGCCDRLYRIEMKYPFPKNLILNSIKKKVGEGSYTYNLIDTFLDSLFLDGEDKGLYINYFIGKLYKLLVHIGLMDTFDVMFPEYYPGVSFTRNLDQIYISWKYSDLVVFDDEECENFLTYLGIQADYQSITPEPGKCLESVCNKGVMLDFFNQKIIQVNKLKKGKFYKSLYSYNYV